MYFANFSTRKAAINIIFAYSGSYENVLSISYFGNFLFWKYFPVKFYIKMKEMRTLKEMKELQTLTPKEMKNTNKMKELRIPTP